jgi:chemotaxis methyl-accepting protein methylase
VFRGWGGGAPVNLAPLPQVTEVQSPWAGDGNVSVDEITFLPWLFERANLDVWSYRGETLRRRLPACLRALRVNSAAAARQKLEREPGLLSAALSAMLIGVTGFFRDAGVFEQIRHTVLPALPRRAGHPRVWSVGCSDGQELYSVAILMKELDLLRGATLLGTDCRAAAVARAREGRYDDNAMRDVPVALARQSFVCENTAWRVHDSIRGVIQWRTADATRLTEPGAWDLILCRNVAMYLRCDVAAQLRQTCEQALRPGGFLIFGKAERPTGSTRLMPVGPCVYRKE